MNDPTTYEQLAEKVKLLHPFIVPKDVSVYSDPIYPANPHPKVATIASLMNKLYTLFIDMRYISASSVYFAPHHDNPISLRHASLFGLEKQVVDLLQMLPYHDNREKNWNFGSDHGEFLFGGEFDEDLRGGDKDTVWWRKCVDPLYYLDLDWKGKKAIGWNLRCEDADNEGEEMEEDRAEEKEEEGWLMTYDHEEYDDAEDDDWKEDMVDGEGSSSEDYEEDAIECEELLALQQETVEAEAVTQREATTQAQAEEAERAKQHTLDNDPRDERLLLYLRPWHVSLNKLGNHGTVLFLNAHNFTISQTDQESGTICDFKHNAIPYLENMILNFKTLNWIPGGLYSAAHGEEYKAYKQLYLSSGWGTSTFDGDRFDELRKKHKERQRQKYRDQEPLRKFCEHVSVMQSRELSKLHHRNAVEKLSSLPPTANSREREEFERTKEQCGREFLPAHYEPIHNDILEGYRQYLRDLHEQGRSEEEVKYLQTLIAETEEGMKAKSFEERDWLLYHRRRKEALKVEEEVKEGFNWASAWRGVPIDLEIALTQEDLEKMARQRFEKHHK